MSATILELHNSPQSKVDGIEPLLSSPGYDEALKRAEAMHPLQFQEEFQNCLLTLISDSAGEVAAEIATLQESELHVWPNKRDSEGAVAIDPSLSPLIIEDDSIDVIKRTAQGIWLAKAAAISLIQGNAALGIEPNADLAAYIYSSIPTGAIAHEIMAANPYNPLQTAYRSRMDLFANSDVNSPAGIAQLEANMGEPQGESLIARTIEAFERTVSIVTDAELTIEPKPDTQMMDFYVERHRAQIEEDASPNVGYLVWRERNVLSPAEAHYASNRYSKRYPDGQGVTIDPRDIKSITKDDDGLIVEVMTPEGSTMTVDFVRRLHAEPMENMELWEELREENPEIYYRLTGVAHDEYNPQGEINLVGMMMNPLNSWGTDKKVDAILSDPKLRDRFGIEAAIASILDRIRTNPAIAEQLGIGAGVYTTDDVIAILDQSIPSTTALRRQEDGLYETDVAGGTLSAEKLMRIKETRSEYVVKLGTLIGSAGKGVFLGGSLRLTELPEEVAISIAAKIGIDLDPEVVVATQLDTWQTDAEFAEEVDELDTILGQAWQELIEYALDTEDAIVMKAVSEIPRAEMITAVDGEIVVEEAIYDICPQMINGAVTLLITRMSMNKDKSGKVNVSSGHGGVGVILSRAAANQLYAAMQQVA